MADRHIWVDDADTLRKLRLFEAMVSDLRLFWPIVVRLQRGWWKSQFESEGRFAGSGWTPLSPVYALQKARRWPGRGILHASGDMRRAADNPERTVTPHTLTLTIDDPKLQYHQDGADRMPARPLVFGDPIPAIAGIELEEAAAEYVAGWVRAFGG